MLAAAYSDPMVVWTIVLCFLTFPSGYLAWVTVQDRRERRHRDAARAEEQAEERRILLMVGKAFFGDDKSQWPSPESVGKVSITSLVERTAHQVKPSNGVTMATMVEQIKAKLDGQVDEVTDLREGMARISVLVAEHVSDGHGGQTSW